MVHHGSNDALNILQQSWRNRWNGSDLVVLVGEGQASPTRRATTCHAWPCLQQRRHGHLQHFMTRSWRHHDEILIVLGKLLEDGQFFLTHTHTCVWRHCPVLSSTPQFYTKRSMRVLSTASARQERRKATETQQERQIWWWSDFWQGCRSCKMNLVMEDDWNVHPKEAALIGGSRNGDWPSCHIDL